MNFLPINCKTHFSLLKGFSKPDKLAQRCAEYGYSACVLADINTLSGVIDFHQACKNHNVKPIIGYDTGHNLLVAKNKNGWFDLVEFSSSKQTIDDLCKVAKNGNVLFVAPESDAGSKYARQKMWGENYVSLDYNRYPIYYTTQDEAELHRIVLCSGMKTTLPKVQAKLQKREDIDNKKFFTSDKFYLKSKYRTNKDERQAFEFINQQCEEYELTDRPMLPKFDCPEGYDEDEYLKELCRHGWKNRLIPSGKVSNKQDQQIYLDRVKHEFEVIFGAKLSGYFLIVQDIVNEVKRRGWLAGPGRGSAAGCLVSYLLGITEVDPIEYDLLFERFYNEGRNIKGHISLPDIDVDVPAEHRDEVIEYIKDKYGHDKVAQMVTFGKLQGRAALKEVLRINDVVSFSEMNDITDSIPDEAKISDQLELMEEKSVIRWALEHESENLKNWCYCDNDELKGPLAQYFDQAIRIEGTNKSQGKHAAGVIVSRNKLKNVCPMVTDKSGKPIAALEMNALEAMGHVKLDILGIDLLSVIMEVCDEGN